MLPITLKIGDVVQISPDYDPMFGGCFMQVTEPKSWGAQGFVTAPAKEQPSYFYRCKFENMELIGEAVWIQDRSEINDA